MAEAPLRPDLQHILLASWRQLAEGIGNEQSPMRTPVLATVSSEGRPNARTIVLRHVDAESRVLSFNTDRRSPKCGEMGHTPFASLVFWDPEARTQLRFRTVVRFHEEDEWTREAWRKLSLDSRRVYMTPMAPGAETAVPSSGLPAEFEERAPSDEESQAGYRNFCVVEATVESLDWLYFSERGHRRAAFHWDDAGRIRASWVIP